MKSSGIGGQAVLEGVMMKNKDLYAVAVRKPDGEIAIDTKEYKGLSSRIPFFKLPIIRGVVAFAESLTIGIKTLTFSASFYEEEDDKKIEKEKEKEKDKEKKAVSDNITNFLTVLFSICLAVGIFIALPYFFSQFLGKKIESQVVLSLIEGVIRILLFIGYVVAISQMSDIKRVFMYHGAEHKTINCIEHGYELTVKNVKRQSKQHKRCGTSFMLIVMFVSIIFFIFIRVEEPWLRLLLRLLLVPVIAGVSYEFLKLAGRSESKIVDILSKPGLLLQGLTTKEPDDSMIEVAIQSVEAVFDWKGYLQDNSINTNTKISSKKGNSNSTNKDAVISSKNSRKSNELKDNQKINNESKDRESKKLVQKDAEQQKELQKSSVSKNSSSKNNQNKVSKNQNQGKKNRNDSNNRINDINVQNKEITKEAQDKLEQELEKLDDILNAEKVEELTVEEKQTNLKSKVRIEAEIIRSASSEIASSLEPGLEDEDDDILKALDKYFDGKKNTGENP